ncbi:hypothetical protein E7X19_05610 [Bacteroides fragilis]|nr:hypothetical protein E7X19_05610 [Bacteroides fragilis]
MDDIPGGELHGVETDRIGRHHRLHGFSRMNYLYFEESSEKRLWKSGVICGKCIIESTNN